MPSPVIASKRPDIGRLTKSVLFSLLACLSLSTRASELEQPHDERLFPLAQTFIGLHLCASYSDEYEQDTAKFEKYSQTAWSLYDHVIATGWDKDLFSSAMVVAYEQRSSLEVREDDTLESFQRRHQSGQPCEKAVATAQAYLSDGIPTPH